VGGASSLRFWGLDEDAVVLPVKQLCPFLSLFGCSLDQGRDVQDGFVASRPDFEVLVALTHLGYAHSRGCESGNIGSETVSSFVASAGTPGGFEGSMP
jgi:hypothetical protein